jgi:hypothetical protein
VKLDFNLLSVSFHLNGTLISKTFGSTPRKEKHFIGIASSKIKLLVSFVIIIHFILHCQVQNKLHFYYECVKENNEFFIKWFIVTAGMCSPGVVIVFFT